MQVLRRNRVMAVVMAAVSALAVFAISIPSNAADPKAPGEPACQTKTSWGFHHTTDCTDRDVYRRVYALVKTGDRTNMSIALLGTVIPYIGSSKNPVNSARLGELVDAFSVASDNPSCVANQLLGGIKTAANHKLDMKAAGDAINMIVPAMTGVGPGSYLRTLGYGADESRWLNAAAWVRTKATQKFKDKAKDKINDLVNIGGKLVNSMAGNFSAQWTAHTLALNLYACGYGR